MYNRAWGNAPHSSSSSSSSKSSKSSSKSSKSSKSSSKSSSDGKHYPDFEVSEERERDGVFNPSMDIVICLAHRQLSPIKSQNFAHMQYTILLTRNGSMEAGTMVGLVERMRTMMIA